MENILDKFIEGAYQDEYDRQVNGYVRLNVTHFFYCRNSFDSILYTIKKALSALEKSKKLVLNPNEVYKTKYKLKAIGLGSFRVGQFVIVTDEKCNPKLGVCGYRAAKCGDPWLDTKNIIFIKYEDLDNSFYEKIRLKKTELAKEIKLSKLKSYITNL